MQKGGGKRKKIVYVYALPTFSHYLPYLARGRLGLGKGHGMATQALACACIIVSIQLFYFFFILFRTLSLHRRGMPS